MDLKVAAAAKLVLQELDPIARKKRQEFSNGLPQALLGIHAKSLRNFSKTFFFTSTFAGCGEIRLFLRITVQGTVKCSKIVNIKRDSANPKPKLVMNRQAKLWNRRSIAPGDKSFTTAQHRDSLANANAEITLDELKTFSLDLVARNDDPRNSIKFELIEVDSQAANQRKSMLNVGVATLHMFDLIKDMYGYKLLPMMVKDKKVADIDMEFVFRYGALGYGYSHQLKQNDHSISQVLSESMLFRISAPLNRRDDEGFLDACEIPHPDFIPFVKSNEQEAEEKWEGEEEERPAQRQYPSSASFIFPQGSTDNVSQLMASRKRLSRMRKEYLALTTRHDRTRFLEHLVAKHGVINTDASNANGADDDGDHDDPDDDSTRQLAGMAMQDGRRQSEAVKVVVENLSPLLLMAPGLQSRGLRSGVINRRSTHDEDKESSDGTDDAAADKSDSRPGTPQEDADGAKRPGSANLREQRVGFMNVLRRKVLAPMRIKRIVGDLQNARQVLDLSTPDIAVTSADEEEREKRKPGTSVQVPQQGNRGSLSADSSPPLSPTLGSMWGLRRKSTRNKSIIPETPDDQQPEK